MRRLQGQKQKVRSASWVLWFSRGRPPASSFSNLLLARASTETSNFHPRFHFFQHSFTRSQRVLQLYSFKHFDIVRVMKAQGEVGIVCLLSVGARVSSR